MPRADRRGAGGRSGSAPGAARLARRKAREFALQGLYQWLLAQGEPGGIVRNLREDDDYPQADAAFVERLVFGTIADAGELSDWMQPFLDRPVHSLSPVERAILLLAGFELRTAPEAEFGAPYRVVINEAVELAKLFGGTDGHKYVNGVLDKLAAAARGDERARSPRSAGGGRSAPAAAVEPDTKPDTAGAGEPPPAPDETSG